ncbi:hypothetical protein DFH06DRAFT_1346485 [Mycena polygramma]|nr:hypothetical protein DFH06DRAFT_1346485 [Mycena polygramma]
MLHRSEPVPTSRRLSATDLTALWIIRVRFLAAQLHHITTIARESETPPRTVEVIRSGIRELAKNMVDLGRASVEHGMDRGTRNDARFFVPAEATALFAMIERFIDSYGYLEDDLTPNREVLFGNLEILRTCMIEAVDYLLAPDDFPNFPLNAVERDWYAFPATLKAHQVTMLRATHVPKRKFGDNLRRYNSELDSSRWYNFPDPTLALVPTRPNTPEVATITWIAVDACALNTGIVIRRATPVQEGSASGAEAEEGELPGEEPMYLFLLAQETAVFYPHPLPPSSYKADALDPCAFMNVLCPHVPVPRIFSYAPIPRRLSLPVSDLDQEMWSPLETLEEFCEYRLRPLVFFLHSAITRDFTMGVPPGAYTVMELSEIKYWLARTMLHFRLIQVSKSDKLVQYLDDWGVPVPSSWNVPGECTAMLEFLYRMCLCIGFPVSEHEVFPLSQHT